jgi:hypothetical protein
MMAWMNAVMRSLRDPPVALGKPATTSLAAKSARSMRRA